MSLFRCLSFTIPAILISLAFGFIILEKIQKKLYLENSEGSIIPFSVLFNAILLGILLPCISSINPVLKSMNLSLSESLNITRSKLKSIFIEVLTPAQRKRSLILPYLFIGAFSLLFGITVYYFLPLSLLSLNLGLLLQVFFLLLISMFLGLVMIAINMQAITEIMITHIILVVEKVPHLKILVLNNMRAHR